MKHIVTRDLVLTVKNKFRVTLSKKALWRLQKIENEFVTELLKILFNNEEHQLIILGEKEILPPLQKIVSQTLIPILSFDDVFSKEITSPLLFHVGTSRQIDDYEQRQFSVGPRCGAPHVEQQLQKIGEQIGTKFGNQVALYDLGIFSGGSAAKTLSSILAAGFDPRIIYSSVVRQVGLERIQEEFQEAGIELICLNEQFEGGWDELRDIIGVHGFKVNHQNVSFISGQETKNTFIPYSEIIDWFSMPYDPQNRGKLISLCENFRHVLANALSELFELNLHVVGKFQGCKVYTISRKKGERNED